MNTSLNLFFKSLIILVIVVGVYVVGAKFRSIAEPTVQIPNNNPGITVTDQGDKKLIVNTDAGYQLEIPRDWVVNKKNNKLIALFSNNESQTSSESIIGCSLSITVLELNGQSIVGYLSKVDQTRMKSEESEPSSTVVKSERNISISEIDGIEREYEPPTGPNYKEIYLPGVNNERVFILTATIGIVSGPDSIKCADDLLEAVDSYLFIEK